MLMPIQEFALADRSSGTALSQQAREQLASALGRVPSGLFVLTSQHEDRRLGMLTAWVQQVCFEPPMVTVAIAKGRAIMPLISESRQFALCQLGTDDRVIMRKFAAQLDPNDDPFLGYDLMPSTLPNLPVLNNCIAHLECALTCHMDVEGDHDLFVGTVLAGRIHRDETPAIHLRTNGFEY
jgi:flavin reductase (DIM6/NTAB) family NADH-FMN oxidoreductase RutF